jgi:hypothetical protein
MVDLGESDSSTFLATMAIKHEFLRYLTRLVGLLENVLGIPDDHLAIGVGSSKDIPFDN